MDDRARSLTWTVVAAIAIAASLNARTTPVQPLAVRTSLAPGSSQTQDASQPQRPVFKTEANYVRVDVFPTVDGQPVPDLTQGDFEVLEDKVPQKIDAFEHVVIRPAGPQETRHEPNTVAQSLAMVGSPRARVFILFLDLLHVETLGSRNIRKPLVDMLNRVIGQDDLIAVMTTEMKASQVAFARRTTTIEGMLSTYWTWGERDSPINTDPIDDQYGACYPNEVDDGRNTCVDQNGIAAEMIDRRREKRTIDALWDLAQFVRSVREERKAILVISDGWRLFRPDDRLARKLACHGIPGTQELFVDPRTGKLTQQNPSSSSGGSESRCEADRMRLSQLDDELEFRRILDEANRANATFYPIDPRGLAVFDEPLMRLNVPGPVPSPVSISVDASRLTSRLESLRTMAAATDGIAVVDSNDLERGLKRISDDLTSYYLLGYYASNAKLDGKFRSITVRVKRPGVQVRARRGYLAPTAAEVAARASAPVSDAAVAAEAEARAIDGALAPLNGTARDVPVRVQIAAGWKPDHAAVVCAVGEVAPGDDWKNGGEADVTMTSANGATLATAHARFEAGARSFRAMLAPAESLSASEYTVHVRVRGAAASGMASNEAVRFMFPAAPDASGAVLSRRGPASGNREVATADPRFRRSEQLRVEVLSAAETISARLLDRTGKVLALPVAAAVRNDPDGSRWMTAQLALAPLAPGDYVIELAGRAGGAGQAGEAGGAGREVTRTLVAFRVVP